MNEAVELMRGYRRDPLRFVREQFRVEPDAWQIDALEDYREGLERGVFRLGWKACKGPGKTALLAWIAWHFLVCFADAKIAATSISGDNLRDGLWTEMSKWQQRSPMLTSQFEWATTRITMKESAETWWMSARSWSRAADPQRQADTLAGLHADYMLFIIDEVGSVPDAVMAAAEAALSTIGGVKGLVIAGNPTEASGPLYRACTSERHLWRVIEITADPEDPKRTPRVSIDWAREQIQKYGRDNPWVLVNVFGKFPPTNINVLLGPDDVSGAMGRHLKEHVYVTEPRIIGVDVARFGDDKTVLFPRQGRAGMKPVEMRNARTQEIVARVVYAFDNWDADAIMVDGTGGYGAGVIDGLQLAGYPVFEVNFSSRANDPRYTNKRAEIYFLMAEWVKSGAALPNIPELTAELTSPQYWFHKNQFQIEDKQQIKDRIGRSPDLADALALTFAQPIMARPRDGWGNAVASRGARVEWDPFVDREEQPAAAHEWDPS